jgi:transcriptional regulator with XRE-family HTH domain
MGMAATTGHTFKPTGGASMTSDDISASSTQQLPEQRIGAAMRAAREANGLSLRKMAKRLHYSSHTTLSSYERGAIMPTEQVVQGYEHVLGLEPGMLMKILEDARIQRHGDAWAKRRVHIPAELIKDTVTATESSKGRVYLAAGIVTLVGAAVVLIVLTLIFSGRRAPADDRQPFTIYANDGADPKDSGCALDPNVETLDSAEVDLHGGPVGLIELRYSPQCGVAWPRFEEFPLARIPRGAIVHVDVVRPDADQFRLPFQQPYVGAPIFGNVMRSTEHCTYAAGRIEITGESAPESRTHCFRGRTATGTPG